jgi:Right handed beta helix region
MRFKYFMAFALALAALACQSPARAAAVVWVSATGSDSNPCHMDSPCATFTHAISTTMGASEVECLTPGHFDTALVITSAVTINCPGGVVVGGITVSSSSGVVILRGIEIQGLGASADGLDLTGGALVLDGVQINGFSGTGLSIQAAGTVSVTNSQITGNTNGIDVEPSSGTALVSLSHVDVEHNSNSGIFLGGFAAGESQVHLTDSVVANNGGVGISVNGSDVKRQFLTMQRSSSVFNGAVGLTAFGTQAFVLVGESPIAWNSTGISTSLGGVVYSYRNNQINGNGTDISGALPQAPLQ